MNNQINIIQANLRGCTKNRLSELKELICVRNPSIVLLNETNWAPSFPPSLSSFHCFRKDREGFPELFGDTLDDADENVRGALATEGEAIRLQHFDLVATGLLPGKPWKRVSSGVRRIRLNIASISAVKVTCPSRNLVEIFGSWVCRTGPVSRASLRHLPLKEAVESKIARTSFSEEFVDFFRTPWCCRKCWSVRAASALSKIFLLYTSCWYLSTAFR